MITETITTDAIPAIDYGVPAVTLDRIRQANRSSKKKAKKPKKSSFSESIIGGSIIPEDAQEVSSPSPSFKYFSSGRSELDSPEDPYVLLTPKVALTAPNATPTPLAIYSERDLPNKVDPDLEDNTATGVFSDE